MRALVCVQCFPPLVKNAGGVSKDYLALCQALIEGLGWSVTLMTPVDLSRTGEPKVDRWRESGFLRHLPAGAVRASTRTDGIATLLDSLSLCNMCKLFRALSFGGFDVVIMDDILFRVVALLLARGLGVPSIASTHTDVTGHSGYDNILAVRLAWYLHVLSARFAVVHATASQVFAKAFCSRYGMPVHAVWPPVLWSDEFRQPVEAYAQRAAAERARWVAFLGFEPRAILLYAGRWSAEKRIHLLCEAVPPGCALVIIGDSDTDYGDRIEDSRSASVLPLRRMLGAAELRAAYAAADLVVSASCFETLGNVIAEAWAAGTPVAVQPVQGHLELVRDGCNSFFVDFDDPVAAMEKLAAIVAAGAGRALQPALAEVGRRLRAENFAEAVERALLQPALRAGEAWKRDPCRRWFGEPLLRFVCLAAWLFLWLFAAVATRLLHAFSRDPSFEYLPAGTAVEPVTARSRVGSAASAACAGDAGV
eukprot:TRINITY_DN19660_c0_g1_i1.p1 TRINITY_DN19660_c0_g1~~TRINITY_DN19660_c0_g1_i1.p1  ORF type:complete len:479 (-),score=100.91 TRINITY_DN19660_c0_g1_i1:118-1554(-)